ncbi:hypothetical protein G9C98_005155 [Cotesia typhae]|uniref:Large ribosomal subunit protein uL10-like insertion domain-containing protein n=1 Tax=Cotesia typhae TaxID=2053667 RepID=A0A8J5R0F3_9HYME|nr:hypothetical protein G9C98_005155 [Cotesia typhae]
MYRRILFPVNSQRESLGIRRRAKQDGSRSMSISLTKTSKKGKALKDHIIDDVRNCVEKYDRICVFAVRNMRNNKLKNLREEWVDSRFFFGKNKIIAIGMGKTPAEEIADVLPEGPLPDFSHAIEPHLRQLGMPTALKKGVVTLIKDYEVCKKGFPLTPEQAKILKLFSMQLATFKLIPLGFYSKKKGYQKIKAADDDDNVENMETEIVDET